MAPTSKVVTLQRSMPVAALCCPDPWKHLEDFLVPFSFSAGKFPLLEGKECDLAVYHKKERKGSLAS